MTLAMLYAITAITLTFVCALNCRRARNKGQMYLCLGITAGYVGIAMVLWLQVLDAVGSRSPVWLATLGALLIVAVIAGLTSRPDGQPVRSIFWSRATIIRRTYRNLIGNPQ